jgi:hypothetical protein
LIILFAASTHEYGEERPDDGLEKMTPTMFHWQTAGNSTAETPC